MTFPRKLGILMILVAIIATTAHFMGIELPTFRWFYSFHSDLSQPVDSVWYEWQHRIIGLIFCSILVIAGVVSICLGKNFHWNPLTLRRMERFRSIGRGYTCFWILIVLVVLAMFDNVLVGKRALAVKYNDTWYFPAFREQAYPETTFGGEAEQETNYRELKKRFAGTGNKVLLPPVPWEPTGDSDLRMEQDLVEMHGRIFMSDGSTPYNGYAYQFQKDKPDAPLVSGRVRDGQLNGYVKIYGNGEEVIARQLWEQGEMLESTVPDGMELPEAGRWVKRIYAPLPPSWERKHFLGTDHNGWDIAAQLFGGLQIAFKAALLYISLTYGFGIAIGCLMGYFGGTFDLIMQRIMEVMDNVPFLLVVMIISNNIGQEKITLGAILIIFCIFSWIRIAVYLRTSTYKEKARDYTSAAKVLGASTPRVIFRHILPNSISTIVTLIPFSVSSVIVSLTALDFLGFGLPDRYPSWGRTLSSGVDHLSSPWIASSVFLAMVTVLLLITFIGEAIREAFDPKKFTTYR